MSSVQRTVRRVSKLITAVSLLFFVSAVQPDRANAAMAWVFGGGYSGYESGIDFDHSGSTLTNRIATQAQQGIDRERWSWKGEDSYVGYGSFQGVTDVFVQLFQSHEGVEGGGPFGSNDKPAAGIPEVQGGLLFLIGFAVVYFSSRRIARVAA